MKPKYYKRKWKTLTNGSDINILVSTCRAWEVNWYPFQGKLWLHRLYQSRVGGGEGKGNGSDVIICAFTRGPRWGELAASPGFRHINHQLRTDKIMQPGSDPGKYSLLARVYNDTNIATNGMDHEFASFSSWTLITVFQQNEPILWNLEPAL